MSADSIQNCETPPPGFEERWCRVKEANGAIVTGLCDGVLDPSGGSGGQATVGGAGGQPGTGGAGAAGQAAVGGAGAAGQSGVSGAGSGGASSVPPPGNDDPSAGADDDSGATIRTNAGCGCRTSRSTTTPAAVLLVLVGLVSARVRRRQSVR